MRPWRTLAGVWLVATVSCMTFNVSCGDSDGENPGSQSADGGSCQVACYSGSDATRRVGACKDGVLSCDGKSCVGEVLPTSETCATAVDDDCDGQVNEEGVGCNCPPGTTESCWSGPLAAKGVGACVAGTRTCNEQGTEFGPCVGEVLPTGELCATPVDDDCDGAVNEDGVDCACEVGTTAACYSGAAGTLGVGPCVAGTQTCNATGTGFGPCTGETLPVAEVCATSEDEDCDDDPDCGGNIVWTLEFPNGVRDITPGPLANVSLLTEYTNEPGKYEVVDPNGVGVFHHDFYQGEPPRRGIASSTSSSKLTLIGECGGGDDVGTGPLPVNAARFVASYELSGSGAWSHGFEGSFSQWSDYALVAVAHPTNDPVLAAVFYDTANFGTGPITGDPFYDFAIARYSSATLQPLWSRRLSVGGSPQPVNIFALASAGTGSVVSGSCIAETDFGGGPMADSGEGLFLVRLDAAGQHVFSKYIPASVGTDKLLVATPEDGQRIAVFVFVPSSTAIDLGGGPLAGVVLGTLLETGGHVWSKNIAIGEASIAMDSQYSVYIAGIVAAGTDFGGGPLAPGYVIAKFNAAGNHVWSRNLPSDLYVSELVVSGANLYFRGYIHKPTTAPKHILVRVTP